MVLVIIMAVRCKKCGAFMECKYNGYVRVFWECLNCKREVSTKYGEIKKKEEDSFV